MTLPVLSLVTVTKNCVTTIERTLDSVQRIKSAYIEYVIVDGASTDGTLEAIESRKGLVDVLVSESDSGIYNAMNKGVSLAQGTYICFINGDDELVESGIQSIVAVLQRGVDGIICARTIVGNLLNPKETLSAKPSRLYFYNSVPHPSSFVRRDLLVKRPLREDLKIASDYAFFLEAFLAGEKFIVLPFVTAIHYRCGASSDISQSLLEVEEVRRTLLGWRYPVVSMIQWVWRGIRSVARNKRQLFP